jgi:alpha/beta superfamily hydrolase
MIDFIQINSKKGYLRGAIHHNRPISDYSEVSLILHGYLSSNRIGPHRLYFQMAETLSQKHDVCVARFDCLAMGESDGSIDEITFDDFLYSYECIFNFFKSAHDISKFCLIGHCIGGNLAIYLANTYPDDISKLVLLAPGLIPKIGEGILNEREITELAINGSTMRKGIVVDKSFFFDKNCPETVLRVLDNINVPFVIFESEKDEYFKSVKLSKTPQTRNIIVIKNADHNFLEPSVRAELLTKVLMEYSV